MPRTTCGWAGLLSGGHVGADRGGHRGVGPHWAVALLGARARPDGRLCMALTLSILYRGPLSSCTYACGYCPFAKHTETREEHERDRLALERFVGWAGERLGRPVARAFTAPGAAPQPPHSLQDL